MQLQIALDGTLAESLTVLEAAAPYVDIVEIGTPLVLREGARAIEQIKTAYPDLPLLADFKIMDAGEEEAAIAFESGADIVTVMGMTQNSTITGAVMAARRYDGKIMVDLMSVSDSVRRGKSLLAAGCDYLCVHTAFDLHTNGASPLENLRFLRTQLPHAPFAVAGGINHQTIDAIAALNPAIVVVGSAITGASDPAGAACRLKERMNTYA